MPGIISTHKGSIDLSSPKIMGILNITPDSFFDGGRYQLSEQYIAHVENMIRNGASLIDVGAVSTRPGAEEISSQEEITRLTPIIRELTHSFPNTLFSIDTYRADVAMEACKLGVHMINDISGGRLDPLMFHFVAESGVPYIMMHMQGSPREMQVNPTYVDVAMEVKHFFKMQINKLLQLGVKDNIILDPGFGFGKTVVHNYQLLKEMDSFKELGCPILAGVSRKSMINKVLGTKPGEALNGTTVLNTMALMKGADILRVHDIKEANEAVQLYSVYQSI